MNTFKGALLLLLLVTMAGTASAGLIGSTINGCYNTSFNSTVTTDTAQCDSSTVGFPNPSALVADPGVEFTVSGGERLIDFNDTSVTIRYLAHNGSASPDLFIFSNLPGTITGLTLLTGNALSVTTAFTGTSIGLLVGAPLCCTTFNTEVTYQIEYGASAIPEPATFAISALGLAVLALLKRRQA